MKKYLFIATALAALASCSDNEFVGDVGTTSPTGQENGVISFTSGSKAVTRSTSTEDAAKLNNEFIFAGTKGDAPTTFVFDQYKALFVQNTAHTTESNSDNWEYVGLTPATTSNLYDNGSGVQSIKYWDYATTQYDFAAYSLGGGVTTQGANEGDQSTTSYATASAIAAGDKSYTLTGSAEELAACYISDLVTAYNRDGVSDYGKPVKFSFRSLGTKIRLAFYETVPGYSVKDVKFYTSSSATLATDGTEDDPTLFTANAVLPSGDGTMTVTFPTTGFDKRPGGTNENTDYNKAHVAFSTTSTASLSSTLTFEDLANLADKEYKEATGNLYIGRASNAATYAGGLVSGAGKYYTFLPNETGANLQLRIKYTLVSRDGSGEELIVDNATAVIPAELAQWQPNYAYTYIFKIGDMTNGSTGVDGSGNVVTGLTPITLDAVVVDNETGVQETITTVSEPSITTYAKGKVVTANDEYVADTPIYIIVNNGTSNETLTNKANLYTVTLAASTDDEDTPAANPSQPISEESVANALANGTKDNDENPTTWTVKDANKWKMVVTKNNSMTLVNAIDATDSPTGNEITIGTDKVGKFTPAAGKNYVFQYKVSDAVAAANADTYTDETAAAYNATLPGAISTSDVAYSFTSYGKQGEGEEVTYTPKYGDGKVIVVSQAGGWTTVLVISNTSTDTSAPSFVGNQYMVHATTLDAGTYYQLYSTAGAAQPIYVKIATTTLNATEVNNYNKELKGAKKNGDEKPAVTAQPAKYQYKVIKVASAS